MVSKNRNKRERVDHLIEHLWSNGYLTLSRKYGKYLPAPTPVGDYEVDAIAKYKKKIAIGLAISEEELDDPNLISKLSVITHDKSKFSNHKITLFLGIPYDSLIKAQMLVASLDDETRSRIKIVTLPDSMQATGLK